MPSCAFPNTPKLRAVRAARGGGAVPVVRADWLEAVSSRRRVVPWRWFATEDRHRVQPTPEQLLDDEPPADTRTDPDSGKFANVFLSNSGTMFLP